MNEILIGGYYKHYKNKPYKVLDVAKHSEDLSRLVIYETLYKNDLARVWARPEKMFLEKMPNGTDRFELLSPENSKINFDFFHCHIYYDQTSKPQAEALHQLLIASAFNYEIRVSNMYDRLLGPHPEWMFEVDFQKTDFLKLIHFLSEHRNGLNILIHPLSGNDIIDHTEYAMFLGEKQNLNLSEL